MNCHNPLRREFWLGDFDPRPLALFRIAIGLVVLHDLVDFTRDFGAFLTDDGMLPRRVPREWFTWSVFDLAGRLPAVAAVYTCGVLAIIAFTLGLYTRLATVLSWVWLVSLHNRNSFITDGGDMLVGILFFWSIFADLGACWSLDAHRSGPRARVPAFGLRLLQAHVAILYYATARLKFAQGWLHGVAVFQVLQLEGFVRPPGAWIGTQPVLCAIGTYVILAAEAAFPICAFAPIAIRPMRAVALFLGLFIQLGIISTMRVGIFQGAMLASCALFILPEWFDRAQEWLARREMPWLQPFERSADRPPKQVPPWRLTLYGALAVQFVIAVWGFFGERRIPLPRFVRNARTLLSIEQPADLFATVHAIPHWSAPGLLTDGTPVEILSVAAPGARPLGPAIRFSRWSKFRFKDRGERPLPWPTLGPYLCKEYDRQVGPALGGPKLASFDVVNDETAPRLPDQEASAPRRRTMWHQQCE